MNLPSIKKLETGLRTSAETAEAIRAALEEARDGYYQARNSDKQYNLVRKTLCRVSDLLGMYGVERIASDTTGKGLLYVNTGDPYAPASVIWDEKTCRFTVGCWGDIVERQEYRFRDDEEARNSRGYA